MPCQDENAGKVNKGVVMVYGSVPPDEHPLESQQPGNGTLNFPPSAIAPQPPAVLGFHFYTPAAMWSNQLNAFFFEPFIQRISVIGTIPDNSSGSSQGEGLIEGSFDKGDFMW